MKEKNCIITPASPQKLRVWLGAKGCNTIVAHFWERGKLKN
ncbi:MAG TPA: hypothetical protein VKY57_01360 [Chitinispirillaceae bacterium]|nr:hypothetical protein [Chitinispirillaceae bacterium]